MARLLRCRFCMSGPWRGPPMPSFGSTPGGDSILITSAPKSANWRTQVGPARTRDRSRMRKRSRAEEAAMRGMTNILCAVFALCGAWAQNAPAQYPERALRFVVPQAAGSATDNIARLVAPGIARELGQSVVVDNRPGG